MEFDFINKFKLEIENISKKRYSIVLITPDRKPIAISTLTSSFWLDWKKSNAFVAELMKHVECEKTELLSALEKISTKILLEGKNILKRKKIAEKEEPEERIETAVEEITDEERAKAQDILKNGDPIKFIGDTIQLMHIGDYEQGQFLWLGTLTPELGYRLHSLMVGSSGSGKSDLTRKVCRCVPANKRIKLDSASSKALYYAVKAGVDMNGAVFNIDDVDPEDLDQMKLLKMMATDDPETLRHWTLTEDRKFVELICKRQFVVFASTLESLTDKQGQLLRRYEILNPSEKTESLEEQIEYIKNEIRAGKSEETYPRDFNVAQAITGAIKSQKLNVEIPFPFNFPVSSFAAKTALKKFAALLWATSKAYFMQRIVIRDTLLAQPEDFDIAVKLWEKRQPLKIDKTAMDVLKRLGDKEPIAHIEGTEGDKAIKKWEPEPQTSTTLARQMKLAPRTVRDKLDHLYDGGLADKKQIGGRGNPWAFWTSPEITEKIAGLDKRKEGDRQQLKMAETIPSIDSKNLIKRVDDYCIQLTIRKTGGDYSAEIEEYKKRLRSYVQSCLERIKQKPSKRPQPCLEKTNDNNRPSTETPPIEQMDQTSPVLSADAEKNRSKRVIEAEPRTKGGDTR